MSRTTVTCEGHARLLSLFQFLIPDFHFLAGKTPPFDPEKSSGAPRQKRPPCKNTQNTPLCQVSTPVHTICTETYFPLYSRNNGYQPFNVSNLFTTSHKPIHD